MFSEREDLDGLRLIEPGKPEVWLMFHGRRHLVASTEVYDSLWSEIDGLVYREDVAEIAMAEELNAGTCLIRAEGGLSIYLLTGSPQVKRYFIPTWESLVDFGFDEAKVKSIPPLALEGVPLAGEIVSGADRRARGG